jgi:hypothetical protein
MRGNENMAQSIDQITEKKYKEEGDAPRVSCGTSGDAGMCIE